MQRSVLGVIGRDVPRALAAAKAMRRELTVALVVLGVGLVSVCGEPFLR